MTHDQSDPMLEELVNALLAVVQPTTARPAPMERAKQVRRLQRARAAVEAALSAPVSEESLRQVYRDGFLAGQESARREARGEEFLRHGRKGAAAG